MASPSGRFTWWYENGQKQAEVDYRAGALGGTWVTWHPNGQKESQAEFRDGELVDQWMHWTADGKLAETRNFNQPAAQQQAQQASKPNRTTNRQSPAATTEVARSARQCGTASERAENSRFRGLFHFLPHGLSAR